MTLASSAPLTAAVLLSAVLAIVPDAALAGDTLPPAARIDFNRDIRPILSRRRHVMCRTNT